MSSMSISRSLDSEYEHHNYSRREEYSRVTSGGDEVEQSVHPVVAEARVTLDTGLLGQDIIVLAFEVADNLLEAAENNQNNVINTH